MGFVPLRHALRAASLPAHSLADRVVQQGERAPRTREHPSPLRVGTSMLTQCAQGVKTPYSPLAIIGFAPIGVAHRLCIDSGTPRRLWWATRIGFTPSLALGVFGIRFG